jgi:hypothetical protein
MATLSQIIEVVKTNTSTLSFEEQNQIKAIADQVAFSWMPKSKRTSSYWKGVDYKEFAQVIKARI